MKNKKRKYKKKNKKGFSLVELLAVIAILGILSGIAIMAYNRYISYSRKKSVETMIDSSVKSVEQYIMDHPNASKVTFDELLKENYINNITDPTNKNENCRGKVVIKKSSGSDSKLESKKYEVSFCCGSYYYTYNSETDTEPQVKGYCPLDGYKLEEIPDANVLNVYPDVYGDRLKTWMEENGNGKGRIHVYPVSITDFNSKPDDYLFAKDAEGNYLYNVVAFGFADSNNSKDLNAKSRDALKKYLDDDRAAIFGHDTMIYDSSGHHNYFNSISDYICMNPDKPKNASDYPGSDQAIIVKEGIFTDYPHSIGKTGDILDINYSHSTAQKSCGEVFLTYNINRLDNTTITYLSTYRNNAFIQTGHCPTGGHGSSRCEEAGATETEQKILANVIFYLVAKQYDIKEDDSE